jgi:hypothetical protein
MLKFPFRREAIEERRGNIAGAELQKRGWDYGSTFQKLKQI